LTAPPSASVPAPAGPAEGSAAPPPVAPRRGLLALLAHLLLSLFYTWPLALDLFSGAATPGTIVEDRNQNLWNLWWAKTALLDLHTNPFHTDWIYWPDGVSLQFHTLNIFNGLFSIPLQAFLPLPEVYDLIVLFSFVMTGWGAYLLLDYILARTAGALPVPLRAVAALVGSAIFSYSAYHVATQRGLLQLISLEWVPFAVLFLLRAVHDTPPWPGGRALGAWLLRGAAPAVIFLALVALVDWYYVMYTLLFTGCYGLYLLGRALARGSGAPPLRRIEPAARVGIVVALFFLLASPLLIPMFAELQQATYMRPAPGVAVENSADLLAFFLPPRFQRLWGGVSDLRYEWPFGNNTYEVYLGYVALALALAGAFWRRRGGAPAPGAPGAPLPGRGFWAALAPVFALLALGPALQVNGAQIAGLAPMPYSLIERIPGLNISRSPDRFAMPLMLCLSVLAAYGVCRTGAALPPTRGAPALLGVALLALMAVELWPAPYPQLAAPIPAYYQTLAQDPGDYAILELPREDSYWHGAYRMYFQTAHHKRIFYGYISREYYHPFLFSTPGFMDLQYPDGYGDLFADGPAEWLTALSQYRVKYVVLYKAGWRPRPPADQTAQYRAEIAQILGPGAAQPVHSDADLEVYAVPPAPTVAPYLSLGAGWGAREAAPGDAHRWIRNDATLAVHGAGAFHGILVFTATALGAPRPLTARLDGNAPVSLTIDVPAREYRVDLGRIPAGETALALSSPGPLTSPKELGMNEDTRLLGIAFSKMRLEQAP
jgi:hypothetical protein